MFIDSFSNYTSHNKLYLGMNCHILINANLVIRCCKKLVFEFTFDFSTLKQFDIVIGMYEKFFFTIIIHEITDYFQ